MKRALLFDFDGTLHFDGREVNPLYRTLVRVASENLHLDIEVIDQTVGHLDGYLKSQLGFMPTLERLIFMMGVSYADIRRGIKRAYQHHHWQRDDRLVELMHLWNVHYDQIVIISNNHPDVIARALTEIGIRDVIQHIETPRSLEDLKPSPRMWHRILHRYSLSPTDCIMIGDSGYLDIRPAESLGMTTFHIHSPEDLYTALPAFLTPLHSQQGGGPSGTDCVDISASLTVD